ncbi:LapD/MoxY N-terminal periplasmic domain-containing protein [Castellaniella sp.]|uniref:bifunctional diguanylate cyclase/phosphodiesterase n=1 Tax=Castellaniella sp. TaxID=1955812 RepID=UPI00355CE8D5
MSLLKQLITSVTLAMAVVLIGATAFSIDAARHYLNLQLQAQSESAATTMALTLSQEPNQDPVIRELLLTVLFDTGNFQDISFVNMAGQTELLLDQPHDATLVRRTALSHVPAWFDRWLPLERHEAQQAVSDGWRELGVVRLTANDEFARASLWRSTLQIIGITLAAGLAWALFAWFLIRWLRRALQDDVQIRIEALARGDIDTGLPPIRHGALTELQGVTQSIDWVYEQVQATAAEREEKIQQLELDLNRDPTTGLANRKFFIHALRQATEQPEPGQPAHGHIFLYRHCHLQRLNQRIGRERVDHWLRDTGREIEAVLQQLVGAQAWLARLNGSDFVCLLPNLEGPEAIQMAHRLHSRLMALRLHTDHADTCGFAAAVTNYRSGETGSDILARLDTALMRAESSRHQHIEYLPSADDENTTQSINAAEQQWRQLLEQALQEQRIHLHTEPDPGCPEPESRMLAWQMLHDPAHAGPISGFEFLPAAARTGLSGAYDLNGLSLALAWLREHPQALVLRISLASLLEEGFLSRCLAILADEQPAICERLITELDAFGLDACPKETMAFARAVRTQGVAIALRRLDEQVEALLDLKELQPAYIRLSTRLQRDASANPAARYLLTAIQETADDLGITVLPC